MRQYVRFHIATGHFVFLIPAGTLFDPLVPKNRTRHSFSVIAAVDIARSWGGGPAYDPGIQQQIAFFCARTSAITVLDQLLSPNKSTRRYFSCFPLLRYVISFLRYVSGPPGHCATSTYRIIFWSLSAFSARDTYSAV